MPRKWIPASASDRPALGVHTDRKSDILRMMKNDGEMSGVCEGYVTDMRSGEPVEPRAIDASFSLGDMWWFLEDVWNLEHNDMELNPEFVAAALAYIDEHGPIR